MLTFCLVVALLGSTAAQIADTNCTAAGVYTATATVCSNKFSDASCAIVYPASTVATGADTERPAACFNNCNIPEDSDTGANSEDFYTERSESSMNSNDSGRYDSNYSTPSCSSQSDMTSEEHSTATDYSALSDTHEPDMSESGVIAMDTAAARDDASKFNMFLVEKEALMELLKICPICTRHCNLTTIVDGAVLKVHRNCPVGHIIEPWSSSNILKTRANGSREQLKKLNLDVSSGILFSGSSYRKVEEFMEVLKCPVICDRTYRSHKVHYCYPAVRSLYETDRARILDIMKDRILKGEKLDTSGDAQYESVGFCAATCRYVIMEMSHRFILHFVVAKKQRGGSSVQLEPRAHLKCINELIAELTELAGTADPIATFTSDRCRKIADQMRALLPAIVHLYDAWHFFRNILLDLIKRRDQVQFKPLKEWLSHIINQLWWSVASSQGDGPIAQQKYMSCLLHICGQHKGFELSNVYNFDRYKECAHDELQVAREDPRYLDLTIKSNSRAHDLLKKILLTGTRLQDLEKVSYHFGTSDVESFNALATKYAPKNLYFTEEGHIIRSMLAIIDWNRKKWDEHVTKTRTVVGKRPYYNKTRRQMVLRDVKSRADFGWRVELLEEARNVRRSMESAKDANIELDSDDMSEDDGDANLEAEAEEQAENLNGTNGPDEDVKAMAVENCPKTCGYCCESSAYDCENTKYPRINCATVTTRMCQDTTWRDIIAADCPASCGFCLLGGCIDTAPDCAKNPSICVTIGLEAFVAANCKRTCGLCTTASTTASTGTGTGCTGLTDNASCTSWVAKGFCTNTFYTAAQRKQYCPRACSLC